MEKESNPMPSLQNQLNMLSQRLAEIERRLNSLERSTTPVHIAKELRKENNPKPERTKQPLHHKYLKKTIDAAKRRYEREHRQ
jgi:hypothetical protein